MKYYAHTKKDSDEKQELKDHLKDTAKKSAEFAEKFNQKEFGRIVGLFHDLGKYSEKFQRRLRGSTEKVDHATAGAIEVTILFPIIGDNILAYCIWSVIKNMTEMCPAFFANNFCSCHSKTCIFMKVHAVRRSFLPKARPT